MPINKSDAYHCYLHDESGNSEWWNNHKAQFAHDYSGSVTPCTDCGKPECVSTFVGKLFNNKLPPAYCEDCKKK